MHNNLQCRDNRLYVNFNYTTEVWNQSQILSPKTIPTPNSTDYLSLTTRLHEHLQSSVIYIPRFAFSIDIAYALRGEIYSRQPTPPLQPAYRLLTRFLPILNFLSCDSRARRQSDDDEKQTPFFLRDCSILKETRLFCRNLDKVK